MAEAWLTEFESRLEQLECAAPVEGTGFDKITAIAAAAVRALAEDSTIDCFLVRGESVEAINSDGNAQLVPKLDRPILLEAAGREFLVEDSSELSQVNSTGESSVGDQQRTLYTTSRLADEMTFVMRVAHGNLHCAEAVFSDGNRAVSEIVAGFVSRHLLSQYESRLQGQAALVDVVERTHTAASLRDAAHVVAQDGAAVLGKCRLSVLTRQDDRFRLQAVTGVSSPDAAAESVRAIEGVADFIYSVASVEGERHDSSKGWCALSALQESADNRLCVFLNCLQTNGTSRLRAASLDASGGAAHAPEGPPEIVFVVELFDASTIPDEGLFQRLLSAVGEPLRRYHQQQGTMLGRMVTSRRRRWFIGMSVLALVLTLLPVGFEVEVPGQVTSADQRHIFAPDDGTIEDVSFKNETPVAANDVLLKMSNADMELQIQQLQGEIDTTKSRLAALRTGRVIGGSTADSGEEQQLEERLVSLKSQLQLLNKQSEMLLITAPFAGTVYRPNPQQELLARPVQRGQRLLEIVPQNPAWQLRLSIPSHLLGYVSEARHSTDVPLSVRYTVRSKPEQDWVTELTSVENAIQVVSGATVCHAVAELQDVPEVELRPGTSVTARISCGRRSLGFVLFREVIEFWQQLRFAWF